MTEYVFQGGNTYSFHVYADVPSFAEYNRIGHTPTWLADSVVANLQDSRSGWSPVQCRVSREGPSAVLETPNSWMDDVLCMSVVITPSANVDRRSLAQQILASLNYERGNARPFVPHRSSTDYVTDYTIGLLALPFGWGAQAALTYGADNISVEDGGRLIRDIARGDTFQDTHSSDSYVGRVANAANYNPTSSTDPARDGKTIPDLAAGDAPGQLARGLGLDLGAIATACIAVGVVALGVVLLRR